MSHIDGLDADIARIVVRQQELRTATHAIVAVKMSRPNDSPSRKCIRNSTAEFLIFTAQEGADSIEARYEDETVWLSRG